MRPETGVRLAQLLAGAEIPTEVVDSSDEIIGAHPIKPGQQISIRDDEVDNAIAAGTHQKVD